MGAVIATRTAKYICDLLKQIKIKNFYWTDSTIVLRWVKGTTKQWKPFVKNSYRNSGIIATWKLVIL